MNRPELSCVMPAYNEEACIRQAVEELADILEINKIDYELVVIDNGSTDGTTRILDEVKSRNARVRVHRFEKNQGFGGAVTRGMEEARGEILGFNCADGEVPPESVVYLYKVIRNANLDLCKAKRIDRKDGFHRKIYSFTYHFIVGCLFQIHVADINGFPVFMNRASYEKVKPRSGNWMINVEILARARKAGLMTAEMDVHHRPRLGGKSHVNRLLTPLNFFIQILMLRWKTRNDPTI